MASLIESLPVEIILHIAELCSWDDKPCSGLDLPFSYTYYLAVLSRTSRHLHRILNAELYRYNIQKDASEASCVLWAALSGNLQTLKLAYRYGADLDASGSREGHRNQLPWSRLPARRFSLGPPLHTAIRRGFGHIVDYLLANGADVHAPSSEYCGCRTPPHCRGSSYPLHTALAHCASPPDAHAAYDFVGSLVRHGAYMTAEGVDALAEVAAADRQDLVDILRERRRKANHMNIP